VSRRAVVDAGPLVAVVRDREEAHARCVTAITKLRSPLVTCWPVITEVAWLLRREPGAMRVIDRLVSTGTVRLVELDAQALSWTVQFMERYATIGAQLADAALMFIAERENIETVFTLDRRDFTVYRTSTGRALTIVPTE
jgi:predicted nucleic acid-binding protein